MKITDAFLGEHQVLLTQLDELSLLAQLGKLAPLDKLNDHADRGAGSTDDWHSPEPFAADLLLHAQLEEELLFTHLELHLGNGGPVEVMRGEHQEIEKLLADLCAAPDLQTAQAPAAALVWLAREHFAKEERMLFPMAEQLLGEDLLAELGERHAARVAPGR